MLFSVIRFKFTAFGFIALEQNALVKWSKPKRFSLWQGRFQIRLLFFKCLCLKLLQEDTRGVSSILYQEHMYTSSLYAIIQTANHVEAVQCINSLRYRSRASVNVHTKRNQKQQTWDLRHFDRGMDSCATYWWFEYFRNWWYSCTSVPFTE